MSAFICTDKHIASCVAFLARPYAEEQVIANLILKANIRSVNYRYNEKTKIAPCDLMEADVTITSNPREVLKLCQSIDYQCCERDDWEGSKAWGWLHYIASQAAWKAMDTESCRWSV